MEEVKETPTDYASPQIRMEGGLSGDLFGFCVVEWVAPWVTPPVPAHLMLILIN